MSFSNRKTDNSTKKNKLKSYLLFYFRFQTDKIKTSNDFREQKNLRKLKVACDDVFGLHKIDTAKTQNKKTPSSRY